MERKIISGRERHSPARTNRDWDNAFGPGDEWQTVDVQIFTVPNGSAARFSAHGRYFIGEIGNCSEPYVQLSLRPIALKIKDLPRRIPVSRLSQRDAPVPFRDTPVSPDS